MSEDLKLGGNSAVTLTPNETNIAQGTTYTLPVENTGTWCTSQNAACYDQSLWVKSGVPNGYLYNWYTATASTGTYSVAANMDAVASICSKGWELPDKNQHVALDRAYGGNGTDRTDVSQKNKFLAVPLNFNYTGVRDGVLKVPSTLAHYWFSTAPSETAAYNLDFNDEGYFSPESTHYKYNGEAIRCVAAQ